MPETLLPAPERRTARMRAPGGGWRRWVASLSAVGLTAALAMMSTPAEASGVVRTGSCVDGGGVVWNVRVYWGSVYPAADGSRRVSLDSATWTTTRSGVVATDSSVRTFGPDGGVLQWLDWSGGMDYDSGHDYKVRHLDDPVSSPGHTKVTVTLGVDGDGHGDCTVTSTEPTAASTPAPTSLSAITPLPAQPASVVYGGTSGTEAYAHPGGLVIAGRDNYQDQAFKDVSAAGGTVLIYMDPVIDNPYGRYHKMLNDASSCGPATSSWPGNYQANEWGGLNDFRVGSVLQTKFRCVLETMVAENPQMAGFFADDLGSRSWFSGFSWSDFPDKAGYRAGAIALTQTLRSVADEHGLIFIVNGTWTAGDGGGYPDAAKSGNALADGGFVEHHDGEIKFFGPYSCSDQWAAQSSVTKGKAVNYAVSNTLAGRVEYATGGCFAYVSQQSEYDPVPPWGSFHPTGLPSRVLK